MLTASTAPREKELTYDCRDRSITCDCRAFPCSGGWGVEGSERQHKRIQCRGQQHALLSSRLMSKSPWNNQSQRLISRTASAFWMHFPYKRMLWVSAIRKVWDDTGTGFPRTVRGIFIWNSFERVQGVQRPHGFLQNSCTVCTRDVDSW